MNYRALLLVVFAVVIPATAAPVDSFSVYVDSTYGSTESTGATAELTFAFREDGADDQLTLTIYNTTPESIGSALTAVGFEVPDSLPLSITLERPAPYFDVLAFNASVSPGWIDAPGGYDVMITSDGNFQGGNPNGAPNEGSSQAITLGLGDTGLTPAQLVSTFEDLYAGLGGPYAIARFQSVGPNGNLSDMVRGETPEPTSLALLAIGAAAASHRRK